MSEVDKKRGSRTGEESAQVVQGEAQEWLESIIINNFCAAVLSCNTNMKVNSKLKYCPFAEGCNGI